MAKNINKLKLISKSSRISSPEK